MRTEKERIIADRFITASVVLSIIVFIIGLFGLISASLDVDYLHNFAPGNKSMDARIAVCFLL